MNELSQEIRVLNCTTELIENCVNHMVCCFYKDDENDVVIEVKPKDIIEKKYFFILLLEIFSPVNIEIIPRKEKGDNLLTLLQTVSNDPCLDAHSLESESIGKVALEFLNWLKKDFTYPIYSQNIGKEVELQISRQDVIYLVGNRCKHTLIRSNKILKKLAASYRDSGIQTSTDEETLVLDDIDNWFFNDFCGYHFTKICEHCSNIYYAIIDYLYPVYENYKIIEKGILAGYRIPLNLSRSDYKYEFYGIMNRVKSTWIPRIVTWEGFTKQY